MNTFEENFNILWNGILRAEPKEIGRIYSTNPFFDKSLIAIKSVRKFVHLEQKLSRIQYENLLLLGRLESL